jgi:DNA-binding NtrC family response regulator
MVVAKDPSLRGLTSAILRQKGFAVREAPSLESEEEVFAGCGESLSLLVVNTDGHDQELMLGVIQRLRNRMDEIRVVLTSASSPEPLDLEAMHATGICFLSLPYSFARFSQAVNLLPKIKAPPVKFDSELPGPARILSSRQPVTA